MVVGQQVVETQIFDRFPDPADGDGIAAKLGLWVDNAYLHRHQPATQQMARSRTNDADLSNREIAQRLGLRTSAPPNGGTWQSSSTRAHSATDLRPFLVDHAIGSLPPRGRQGRLDVPSLEHDHGCLGRTARGVRIEVPVDLAPARP
jgi:hypothetical protein